MTHVRAVPRIQIDEAAVRVTEWRLACFLPTRILASVFTFSSSCSYRLDPFMSFITTSSVLRSASAQ